MKTYLVVKAIDETGASITVEGARLINERGELEETFVNDANRGMNIEVSKTPLGSYQLRLSITDHPVLTINGTIIEKGSARHFQCTRPTPRCITVARKQAQHGDSSSPALITVTLTCTRKHEEVVLVAGWDYSSPRSDSTHYAATYRDDHYHGSTNHVISKSNVIKDVKIERTIFDHTRVTLFDFKTGYRVRWMKGQTGWHEVDRYLQGTVPTHTAPYNEPDNMKKRHDDDSISITHVYEYVIGLGRSCPGCLVGFHIFSHAWAGGPILVNTYESHPYNNNRGDLRGHLRDPQDKDGRTKDFALDNMPALSAFKAAFHSDAHIKIWGCHATTAYREVARAAAKARIARKPATEMLYFDVEGQQRSASQAQIEKYFRDSIFRGTYMMRLANAINVPVFGAPPIAGSNYLGLKGKWYMYIDQSAYSLELGWLKDALSVYVDEVGYVRYG